MAPMCSIDGILNADAENGEANVGIDRCHHLRVSCFHDGALQLGQDQLELPG